MLGCGLIKDQKKRYYKNRNPYIILGCGLIKDQKKRY